MRQTLSWTYKVIRSIILSVIVAAASLYLIAYIILSIPPVQEKIKGVAERELSSFLGGKLEIGRLELKPFNEVVLTRVSLADPAGQVCICAGRIGAGIDLWRLISDRKIEITYAELISPDVRLWKDAPDAPVNIRFLIDAVSPKDKSKPPAKFDLRIRNVVLRDGRFSFDKKWLPGAAADRLDFNHLVIKDIRADIEFPRLKNDDFSIDLRRLAFRSPQGLDVEKIGCEAHLTPTSLSVNNLVVQLPGTDIRPADIAVNFRSMKELGEVLRTGDHSVVLVDAKITPSDFKALYPPLAKINTPVYVDLEADGNLSDLSLRRLELRGFGGGLHLSLAASARNLSDMKRLSADVASLRIEASEKSIGDITSLFGSLPDKVRNILAAAGSVSLNLSGSISMPDLSAQGDGILSSRAGNLDFSLDASGFRSTPSVRGRLSAENLALGSLLSDDTWGNVTLDAQGDVRIDGRNTSGRLDLSVPSIAYRGRTVTNIKALAEKNASTAMLHLVVSDPEFSVSADAEATLAGAASSVTADAVVDNFRISDFHYVPALGNGSLSGSLSLNLSGNNVDNICGDLAVSDLSLTDSSKGPLSLSNLTVSAKIPESGERSLTLDSDWLNFRIYGDFIPSLLPGYISDMLASAIPSLVDRDILPAPRAGETMRGDFALTVYKDTQLREWLQLPVEWFSDVTVEGDFDSNPGSFHLHTSLPYLLQGKDKLIRDTSLAVTLEPERGYAGITAGTLYPTKKGDLRLDLNLSALNDNMTLAVDFNKGLKTSFYGNMLLGARFSREAPGAPPAADVHVFPSVLFLNKAEWRLAASDIRYREGLVTVDGFNLGHDNQHVIIGGTAGASPDDVLRVDLANIDIQYIFDTLNINYVNFGGIATGEVVASGVLSGNPVAKTTVLKIKDLKYNNSLLGDGDMSAGWDNAQKCVRFCADIAEGGMRRALVDGGIWVTRDSLSIAFDANKVNAGFLQPFMAAFADKFEGRASGKALLYGTFSDVDMRGRLFADTVSLKVGYTNVTYSGSDSVIIDPGHIHIPPFRLYDKYGNTAVLRGDLKHRYFHDPVFNFSVTNAKDFLLYDTDAKMNPDWYGTVFGNGTGSITGKPGIVTIGANMQTARNTRFTFALNDRQNAGEYRFLHFTDRRREALEAAAPDTVPEFMKRLQKRTQQLLGPPTEFAMDLRIDATPQAQMTLVMDPSSGDKIVANGSGSLSLGYDSKSDEMTMYGSYTLDQGKYNFSLQDLILKDFTIRPGSKITFNGDPLDADLDITAAYRVNTNLTDLDESFRQDKELNRTNVPVDAVLMVRGEMTSPQVTFDIELPTLADETQRKVKSIISTEDMMSRQIIYLLALNRFYTPEYMGVSSNGGEWASVASSTLSSQLSNMLGQLTNKVNVMPSLRSDKGDFSDVEVDVALSSRLLNNRLLINGNFGYRDNATSNTTFVGDFDIEYLLNRSGNFRLKAYNHFNDQNYYLRSALTTQGIGVIFRKEFNNLFTFLKRKKKQPVPKPVK